jgi:hypothetical protein
MYTISSLFYLTGLKLNLSKYSKESMMNILLLKHETLLDSNRDHQYLILFDHSSIENFQLKMQLTFDRYHYYLDKNHRHYLKDVKKSIL